ncbi:(Fe-S)-binding protein [Halodesulfovibrio marinisediminis]|uniref:L-lactate dehydrogenase complex protein LldE n=1 Tax=Halodesulfovibrio marinisediminis DSM 17456 TaxID=1121457 RepID=A0A1N6I4K3_9BACT|nr:(Fe-S)-binding protein [Halodesulfovibrio marinisediminis]SIO26845.1 L-lactate dehydrogenase complex protein LldE [Halodesulfovibrio marinisediminis DSM 17456]
MKKVSTAKTPVYFFGTCLADMMFAESAMAAIRLIEREGYEVVYPMEQSCCGQPAYNSGFPEEAKEVAWKQVQLFSKHDYPIVVPSGSCAGMMKVHYPKLFKDSPDLFIVKRFSERVVELTTFLHQYANAEYQDRGAPVKVTWHSSCHAMREANCIADSKALIAQLSNVELIELERERECCGFGGTFSIKQPEISGAMVSDKVADVVATGASVVLSGDCGCLMNITGHMEKENIRVKGQHIAEFIWERING